MQPLARKSNFVLSAPCETHSLKKLSAVLDFWGYSEYNMELGIDSFILIDLFEYTDSKTTTVADSTINSLLKFSHLEFFE